MVKNSFSLIETLISVVILSILSVGIVKLLFNSTDVATINQNIDDTYNKLLNNTYISNNNVILQSSFGNIEVSKYVFEQNGIVFYRYKQ